MSADTILIMLPTPSDNGARLAAILPTGLASLALGAGAPPAHMLKLATQGSIAWPGSEQQIPESLPAVRSLVFIVVDGLGHANVRARSGHARTFMALPQHRIETVIPSTTGAALTTLLTGRLPGEHGLIGYKIRHPQLGLINTLSEWQGIQKPYEWQRCDSLLSLSSEIGVRAIAIGRPAHAKSALTSSILAGAQYHSAQTVDQRFDIATRLLADSQPALMYLYVDELDRAAHKFGWQSQQWLQRLEQFDAALAGFLNTLPSDTGVLITADHGIVDVEPHHRYLLDVTLPAFSGVMAVGGEPRMRSLYLAEQANAQEVAQRIRDHLGNLAWVTTRGEAISAHWFGPVATGVPERLGEVLVVARRQVAFTLVNDSAEALSMVGQHGALSDDERGVPLALGGCLAGTGFYSALRTIAGHIRH